MVPILDFSPCNMLHFNFLKFWIHVDKKVILLGESSLKLRHIFGYIKATKLFLQKFLYLMNVDFPESIVSW